MIRVFFIYFVSCLFTPASFMLSKIHYIDNETVILIGGFESKNALISYVTINGHKYIIKQKKRSKIHYTGNETVILIGGFESKNAFISYVTINGRKYIIKQKKRFNSQLGGARDALAAYIAKDLGIAHSVEVISSKIDIPGKINSMWPATIHTTAAGKTIRSQPESKYHALSLKQRLPGVKITGLWLTEKIINQMTWHDQLPIIIALDLFICNTDRHGGNLFYDPETDSFCAIDMDGIFRRNLPEMACEKLDEMVNIHQKQFTEKEIIALVSVKKTLTFLLNKYTSKHLINKFHFFVDKAGITKGSFLYTARVEKKIAHHESMIIKSRASLHKLIIVLDKIIISFYAERSHVNDDNYFINMM